MTIKSSSFVKSITDAPLDKFPGPFPFAPSIPSVQVITVTKNDAAGLCRTARSLAHQTVPDFKWIVIDGGSKDATPDLLKEIPKDHIRYSGADKGIYDAMNKGIDRIADRGYVLFLNAGDFLAHEGVIEAISKIYHDTESDEDAFQENDLQKLPPALIFGDSLEQIGPTASQRYFRKKCGQKRDIGRRMPWCHQALFYRADLLKPLRYDTRYEIAADYDLTWRYLMLPENDMASESLLKSGAFVCLEEPVCVFAHGGLSQRRALQGRAEEEQIRRIRGQMGFISRKLIRTRQALANWLKILSPRIYILLQSWRTT